jgi:hypothetical protein
VAASLICPHHRGLHLVPLWHEDGDGGIENTIKPANTSYVEFVHLLLPLLLNRWPHINGSSCSGGVQVARAAAGDGGGEDMNFYFLLCDRVCAMRPDQRDPMRRTLEWSIYADRSLNG